MKKVFIASLVMLVFFTGAVAAAATLAARPAAAFSITKEQLRAPAVDRMRSGRARFDVDVERLWAAPETLAAIRSYINRTFKRDAPRGR